MWVWLFFAHFSLSFSFLCNLSHIKRRGLRIKGRGCGFADEGRFECVCLCVCVCVCLHVCACDVGVGVPHSISTFPFCWSESLDNYYSWAFISKLFSFQKWEFGPLCRSFRFSLKCLILWSNLKDFIFTLKFSLKT